MPAPAANPRTYSELHRDPPLVHVLYDDISLSSQSSSSPMLGYLAHRQNAQLHLFPSNPYPSPPQPPPIAHKVWILDCRSCNTFLTNRGMKAVLLLRPNVSLYSSDALPINCSAYTSNPDALRPRSSCRPPSSHLPPRTCECLTQTLCCHGCGSTIGYMIVIPCARCTSSITTTNRATNGHRFVFHSSEIVATERHYVAEEPGVIPYDPIPIVAAPEPHIRQVVYSPLPTSYASSYGSSYHTQQSAPRSRSSSPERLSDYLPTPPLEFADPSLISSRGDSFPFPHEYTSSNASAYLLPPGSISRSPLSSHDAYTSTRRSVSPAHNSSSPPLLVHSSFGFDSPAEQKEQPIQPRRLSPGDHLFWHHLARNGEIPGVQEDPRARGEQPSVAASPAVAGGKVVATLAFNR